MKKTTKIFSLLLAFILCMGIMSVNVFAANYSKKTTDTASLPGYELYAYVRFYELVREGHMLTRVKYVNSSNTEIDMDLFSSMTIAYADGTYGGGQNFVDDGTVGSGSIYLDSNLYVTCDTNKIVDAIFTNHRYRSAECDLDHYIFVDMYAGIDFPEE